MVLTAAQTTAFFESPDQMGIPHATMVQIQHEGIQSIADLADFEKASLQQLADNLRNPGGRIPDPDPNVPAGATIPTPAFTYGAKSPKRLTVACDLALFWYQLGSLQGKDNDENWGYKLGLQRIETTQLHCKPYGTF